MVDLANINDDMSTEEIAEAWEAITDAIGDLREVIDDKLAKLGYDLYGLGFDKRKELDRNRYKLPDEIRQLLSLHDCVWDAY